ncbi:DUF4270 family protein [Marivirga sp. S37H4]|uniref:DUF4270 family protein n=1 Tax=Marivirga aurantiaca TaxID=2802615 RepID=A0A934WZB3_9BACT|nr:DUF4270 family protein [Marivirga aurantiaca]MBK6265612.1 DUF4270 family protein [Marivirga aurantiaca]
MSYFQRLMKIKELIQLKKVKDSPNPISIYIQNWLVKPTFLIGPVVLLALFFQSCEEPIEVTGDLVPGVDNTELRFVELPLQVQQSAYDSVLVSSNNIAGFENRVYIGQNNDPQIGDVKANAFVGAVLPGNFDRSDVSTGSTIVRTRLYMNFNYFYGEEFTSLQSFRVSQLSDTLANKNYTIYDEIGVGLEISEENSMIVAPTDTVTTFVPIKNSFGSTMLSAIANDDLSNSELYEALKGFKIETTGDAQNIQGLNIASGASYFELIYEDPQEDTLQKVTFNLASASFTQVGFQPGSLIPSDYSGRQSFDLSDPSKVYFNNMLGIFPVIDFKPYLDFIDTVDFMLINSAEFVISNPEFETIDNNIVQKSPPEFIVPYILNKEGVVEKVAEDFWAIQRNFNSNGGMANPESATSPVTMGFNKDKKVINADISFFLQEIFDNPGFWNPDYTILPIGRIISRNPTPFNETPTMPIGNFNNFLVDKSEIKLKVYYTTFK